MTVQEKFEEFWASNRLKDRRNPTLFGFLFKGDLPAASARTIAQAAYLAAAKEAREETITECAAICNDLLNGYDPSCAGKDKNVAFDEGVKDCKDAILALLEQP